MHVGDGAQGAIDRSLSAARTVGHERIVARALAVQAELAARNLTSIWAADAETAEHLMRNNIARAVVLDLLLPGLSGEAFLQRLRQRHGLTIPVVVATLKDLELSENLALQKLGVTAVLRKGPGMAETAAELIENSLVAVLVAS